MHLMPELIIRYLGRAPERFELNRVRITIGRSARNDLCLADPFASRVHAEIRREGDQYLLRDLNSANGTYYAGVRIAGPVPLSDRGIICIGETEIEFRDETSRTSALAIDEEARAYLPEATISLSSSDRTTSGLLEAIEAARRQRAQKREEDRHEVQRGELLALISKVGITLLASATLDETLHQVASLVFEAVPADRCMIMMRDSDGGELQVRVAETRERRGEVGEFRISRSVVDEVIGRGRSVLTSDAEHDPRFAHTTTVRGIRSVLAVPLGVEDRIFGMVYADSPLQEVRFTEDHLKILTTLASVAAIRVENARLAEEQIKRQRLEQELQLAREIQQSFQPAAPPRVKGYELEGISFPCYEIGGDYYDFIERPDGKLVIVLGDVSGKGTSAALLMSSLHAAVRAHVFLHESPVEVVKEINRYLTMCIPSNRFVTLFYAEIEPSTGQLSFVNAGHNPPLLARASGETELLAASGIPLGIFEEACFVSGSAQLKDGDALILYSDGISEARNAQGEEFGLDRLTRTVIENNHLPAAALRDQIEGALSRFTQGAQATDDITLVIVKKL
ncbi:serine phosphatase RsbU, regulator of sigma subunit [Pyrinomonas methylaliphatogenes]|uniref:Serine phosphatase RsbU, regulator of sigma subunit n=2 Tax=Pyrinomonas methylaliphatogenes TaxID=454194 RepID=A0A0B6X042_9BACT|nr:serine phosphatase RsbU, regulator of sigma subunit [Pyrinomonas methylaliphatogenes]